MSGTVSIERIRATVAAEFEVSVSDLISQRRHKSICIPRHIAMYLACQLTPASMPAIGRMFGRRDHTTIHAAHRKIAIQRESDRRLADRLCRLEQELAPKIPLSEEIQLAFLTGPLFDWLHDPRRPQPTLTLLEAA
jgi:hypothetical protein